jgi:photosystem II stability/assembly factor-like uncharacterized protein
VRWRAAVGKAGAFAQTFDDVSWVTRSIAAQDLYAVTCVGNDDGWAVGAAGAVTHTLDGGRTWNWQDAHTTSALRAIRFGSATLGLLAGDSGMLAVTHDGGGTWETVPRATLASLRGVALARDAGVMIAVGDGGVVLRSSDVGATWTQSAIAGAGNLRGVASDQGAHWVLTVDSLGSVWSSSDAGVHFVRETTAGGALDGVAMADDGTSAVAVGAQGTILERRLGAAGAPWQAVPSGTKADLHAALVTGDAALDQYVAGDAGTLLHSPDRGATWVPVSMATRADFYGVDDL